jgi:sulfonate transport system ATP-binding protein
MALELQRDLIPIPAVEPLADQPLADRHLADRSGAGRSGADRAVVITSNVRRRFGERVVLDGIDLELGRGEFAALLGRSGTGKSTFLRALAGLDAEFEGVIDVPDRRAVVFQEPRLLPWKRVLANIVVGLKGDNVKQRARDAISEVGLATHEHAWPRTLSGGEAQRVALARALVREPDLLLLDEPFGALDALTRIRMHTLLQELVRRHRPAVLLVTHDVDEAILLADRIVVLETGRISVDLQVDIGSPRLRRDSAFGALRSRLLDALGVDELAEGDRR